MGSVCKQMKHFREEGSNIYWLRHNIHWLRHLFIYLFTLFNKGILRIYMQKTYSKSWECNCDIIHTTGHQRDQSLEKELEKQQMSITMIAQKRDIKKVLSKISSPELSLTLSLSSQIPCYVVTVIPVSLMRKLCTIQRNNLSQIMSLLQLTFQLPWVFCTLCL